MLPTPSATPTVNVVALEQALGGKVEQAVQTQDNVDGHGGKWVAAYVKTSSLRRAPKNLASGEAVLVVARMAPCPAGSLVCGDPVFPYREGTPLLPEARLAFTGAKLRFFSVDPVAPAPRAVNAFSRFLRFLSGKNATKAMTGILKIYDADVNGPVTTIARVDLSARDRYDPLVEHPNGSTTFLSPAGKCVRGGAKLPVPSLCRPGASPGDCPKGASCVAMSVVVATDLSTDRNHDGVPDEVLPPPRAVQHTARKASQVRQPTRPARKQRH
jgi:hypothetical protein